MSEETTTSAPAVRVTLKGQGQSDPWLTIEGASDEAFRERLVEFLEPMDEEPVSFTTAELIAKAAAVYVTALNAQPGISQQRDQKAAQPAAAQPAASGGGAGAGQTRPGLSSSLSPESDGNYWISTGPYVRDASTRQARTAKAKALGARYSPDEAPASIPKNQKGQPERPWRVHLQYVSEENQAELLRLHETGFAEVK